jgi:hypothetical protein
MFERGSAADLAEMIRFLVANPAIREVAGRAGEEADSRTMSLAQGGYGY